MEKNIINTTSLIQKSNEQYQLGKLKEAISLASQAVDNEQDNDEYHHYLGVLYQFQNNVKKAENCFETAISLNADKFIYHYNLGIVYKKLGKFEESLKTQQSALILSKNNTKNNSPYLNEIGLLQMELDDFISAEETLLKAYKLNPQDLTTCTNLSHLYSLNGKLREAIDFSQQAININPEAAESYYNFAVALFAANFYSDGLQYLQKSISKSQGNDGYKFQSMLMNMLYADDCPPETILSAHQDWANTYLSKNNIFTGETNSDISKNKILNIGFVSADFRDHSIAYFLFPLLENLRKDEFQFFFYSNNKASDKRTHEFKKIADHWCEIRKKSDLDISNIIKKDEIDILIDLSGQTGGTRINMFSHRPAPIQISYLGYPFSTGLKQIDYRIVDNITDPVNTCEQFYTEKLVRIEPSFLCYKPNEDIAINSTIPFELNNYITFGCLNNFSKISPDTVTMWAGILLNVKNSRLILKNNQTIPDLLKDHILSIFEENGVHHSRIEMHYNLLDKNEHLAFYHNIDICLDPFPYNGTTTTFEALYMGVPVITRCGKAHYQRVGSSILKNMNLEKFVANSPEEYIEIAINLASDINKIKFYRKTLRGMLLESPLTDAKPFGKNFGELLKNVWKQYCNKN